MRERRSNRRRASAAGAGGVVAAVGLRLWTRAAHRPVDSTAILAAAAASLIIVVNALFLQSAPHTAPFVATPAPPPRPAEVRAEMPAAAKLPEAPGRTTAGQHMPQPVPTRRSGDPIGDLIGSSIVSPARLVAVQRALSEFGYGQIRPSGVLDEPTIAAISRFEADHKMPVTGRLSERLFSELAALTGHPIQ